MRYFNFDSLVEKYSNDFYVVIENEGAYESGEYVKGERSILEMRGAILEYSEYNLLRSTGTLTNADRVLLMLYPIERALENAKVYHSGKVYGIKNSSENAEFTGVWQYDLKFISAFGRGEKIMVECEKMRKYVVDGLQKYLNIPVIRGNQNAPPPEYPYVSYTITTLESKNKGTYGEYTDSIDRKPVKQTWSVTVQSDNADESMAYASKAREWFEHTGKPYLDKIGVAVEQAGDIGNRDNIISTEYEYKNGFDVVFVLFDKVNHPDNGYIEGVIWR